MTLHTTFRVGRWSLDSQIGRSLSVTRDKHVSFRVVTFGLPNREVLQRSDTLLSGARVVRALALGLQNREVLIRDP